MAGGACAVTPRAGTATAQHAAPRPQLRGADTPSGSCAQAVGRWGTSSSVWLGDGVTIMARPRHRGSGGLRGLECLSHVALRQVCQGVAGSPARDSGITGPRRPWATRTQ